MPIIWDYVDTFEKRFGTEAARARARSLMIAYLSQLEGPLPESATKGLATAKRFHVGSASDDERAQARQTCWDDLGHKKNWLDMTPENCILRAVISALDDAQIQNGEPQAALMGWFFYFMDKFEGRTPKKFEGCSTKQKGFLEQFFSLNEPHQPEAK
jgi:hypothetical protein